MSSTCTSVKSKKELFNKCQRKCIEGSEYCSIHFKQKNIIKYDSNRLSPLNSNNDIDIISLEKIHYLENGKRMLSREIKPEHLFTYIINVDGKNFQRTLNIISMKNLIDTNHLRDPFSNVSFPLNVINEAKEMIKFLKIKKKKLNKKEQINILINNLIEKFQEIGYIIHPEWIKNMKKIDYIKWFNEVHYLWKEFRHDHIDIVLNIYPSLDLPHFTENKDFELKVLQLHYDLTTLNIMGTMIVLTALAYSNEVVKLNYPDIN